MQVAVLGPLQVSSEDGEVRVAGPMPRGLLALLAAGVGHEVTVDELIFGLWGDQAPTKARRILHSHASRLRRALGQAALIVGGPSGYRLDLPATDVDAIAFEEAAAIGRAQLDAGDATTAAATLRAALALWRGRPYSEFENCAPLEAERERLDQLRLDALQWRITAELADPAAAPPVAELENLVVQHPTREALWALLMRALYRVGRQADALAAYQRATRMLREELGLDPGTELRRTQELVLAQDSDLSPPHPPAPLPPSPAATILQEEQRTVSVLAIEAPPASGDVRRHGARIASFRATVAERAARYGGTPIEHRGRRTIAVFGTPVAHEDDAKRAVAAARAVLDAWTGSPTTDQPRAAVATGQVVSAGNGRLAGPPLGEVGRLLAKASPGAVAVDTVTEYLLAAAQPPSSGSDVTPFVGRSGDLAVLRAAFERVTASGTPQLVTVVGEAGIGKSRLVAELLAELAAGGGAQVYTSACAAYGDAAALHPLAQVVRMHAGITDGDDRHTAIVKLAGGVPAEQRDEQLPWLEALIGLRSDLAQNRFDAFSAWHQHLASLASVPTVVVIEDVHWAQPALLDFLEGIAREGERAPLLVLTTARPELIEFRPAWLTESLTLRLEPLGDDAMAELSRSLLGPVDEARHLNVVQRSGGVPLFLREFARLAESDVDVVDVPDTLAALLSARLDTIDPGLRGLLCVAAVAGRNFVADAIAAAVGADIDEMLARLETLSRRQFIRRVRHPQLFGRAEYRFVHDLVVDAAYQRLVPHDRARYHLALARWWSGLTGDRADAQAEVIAHHAVSAYTAAADVGDERLAAAARPLAASASLTAGSRLQGLDTAAAIRLLARAVELTEPDSLARAQAMACYGAALHDDRQFAAALDQLDRALPSLEAANDPMRADALMFHMAVAFQLGLDLGPSLAAAERAAADLPPSRAKARALAVVAMDHIMRQTPDAARTAVSTAEQAFAIAGQTGRGGDAFAHVIHGRALLLLGDERGLAEIEAWIDDVAKYESGSYLAAARQWLAGALHHWRGPAAEWEARQRNQQLAGERGLAFMISTGRSEDVRCLYELGRFRDAVALADEVGAPEPQLRWTVVQRALALLELGELDAETVQEVEATPPADSGDLRHVIGSVLVRGRWALGRGGSPAEIIAALGDPSRYTERDGAYELLPALQRLAWDAGVSHLSASLAGLPDTATPLRAAVDATIRGLTARSRHDGSAAREELNMALRRWEALDFVTEAAAVRRDLATLPEGA